ncbi:MAG TPA: porin family protein [Flavitalea sp.]|nr:porin family protein [Flavitalea sp.]
MKLIRVFTSFLVFSIFVISANGQQQQTAGEWSASGKFGIKGGINLSNLYVDNVEDENMKIGLNLGFFAKVPIVRGFSIQPELLYSSKGSKLTYNNLLGQGEYRFNLNYVELPVLGVINLARNFNLHGGVYAGYLVSANIKEMDENGNINEISDLNEESFNRFDYGLVGGLGVDVQNFTIGARYNYGLQKIGESGSVAGTFVGNAKNSAITLYIGFGF